MPQLDVITFVDQSVYVYIFFVLQYTIVSVFIIPGIYQTFALKRLFFESISKDTRLSLVLLINALIEIDTLESEFENSIGY